MSSVDSAALPDQLLAQIATVSDLGQLKTIGRAVADRSRAVVGLPQETRNVLLPPADAEAHKRMIKKLTTPQLIAGILATDFDPVVDDRFMQVLKERVGG